jgi:hypothetical protein
MTYFVRSQDIPGLMFAKNNATKSYKVENINSWEVTRLRDGEPFVFVHYKTKKKFILCLSPKSGSTQLKFLLRKGIGHHQGDLTKILNEAPHGMVTNRLTEFHEAFNDASVPRFIVVRNPYSRMLFGYLSENHRDLNAFQVDDMQRKKFHNFVTQMILYQKSLNTHHYGNHFNLQSNMCHLKFGMTYDYFLKIEQFDEWYESFVIALDLVNETRTGWDMETQHYKSSKKCFYTTPQKTCDTMFESNAPTVTGISSEYEELFENLGHSDSKFFSLFTTVVTKELTDWVKPDLDLFHYPAWDGIDATSYLKNITAS